MKFRLISFFLVLFSSCQMLLAQNLKVEGVVSDTNGEAVIGATVLVKGTQNGTITDFDGKFTLTKLKTTDVLVVSYVGMVSQEVKAKEHLDIVLQNESQQVEEVLVVAFGQQKRSSFTGSATVVDSKKLELRQVTNAMSALDGQVAGLQMVSSSGAPDATPSLLIRGISSINSGTSPLIIVDGAPYDGGINNINPADIESMTVLKDAASNALYGARGANGVIMITTKQASRGDAKITLDAKWGVNNRGAELYETITDPRLYYETHYRSLYNYYVSNGLSLYNAHQQANKILGGNASSGGLGYLVYTAPQGEYLIGENGKMNPAATLGNRVHNNGNYYTLIPDNWIDNAFKQGLRQEYNLNVNGGNDKSQFYASVGYLKNDGIVKASGYERYTARLKAASQAKKWLKVGGTANFSHSDTKSVDDEDTGLFAMLSTTAPIYPLYLRDANGNVMTDQHGLMYDYGNGAVNGAIRPVLSNLNPLQTNSLDISTTNANQWSIHGYTDITPLEGLKITFNGTASDYERRASSAVAPFYGFGQMSYPSGYTYKSMYRTVSLNFQQLVNYSKSFGQHTTTFLLGHEYYKYTYETLSGSKTGMADYWGNQELAGAVNTVSTTSTASNHNIEGFFFRGMYDYADKYFANVSFRRDASSRFHPDHRWGSFYSFGGAWMLTKESWLKDLAWLNMLKLKGSWGQQGNDAIGDFRYTDTYTINNQNGEVALTFNSKGNEKISWETNSNMNFGLEFELFKNRLSGGVEYFHRKTTDMLLFVSDPMSSGYTGHYENVGDMVNKGVEVELNAVILNTKDFSWDVNLNLTHFTNQVTYLNDENKGLAAYKPDSDQKYKGGQSGNYFIGEGLPRYTWYLPHFLGVDSNGQALYYCKNAADGSGTTTVWSSADYMICGDPTPDFYGGFGTSLAYRGLGLSIGFAYSVGGDVFDDGYRAVMAMPSTGITGGAFHKDILNAWTPQNTTSNIPRLQFNDLNSNYASSRWITDGSYLALQNINLNYTFPTRILKPLRLTGLKVYVSGENLYIWSHRRGMDPRSVSSFNGFIANSNYVPMRTITAGLTVNF